MLTVPFENLDIHLGRPIILDEEKLFDKIVRQRRGGFCYELNGLFASLLLKLGFKVTLLSARVMGEGGLGPEFDHLTLLVQLEERWLADVGFGDSFVEPLRLDHNGEQLQGNTAFRLRALDGQWTLLRHRPKSEEETQYVFTLSSRALSDFAGMCHYHQTSLLSHFTQQRICSLATHDGRTTLSGMRLIVSSNGGREETVLPDEATYAGVLRERFGIEIC